MCHRVTLICLYKKKHFVIIQTNCIEEYVMSYGVWGLIPPLLAIILALVTKQVIIALFLGVYVGSLFLQGGNPIFAMIDTISDRIIGNSLADSWNIGVILFCLLIGGLVGIITKIGGTAAVANAVAKKAQHSKATLFWTAILGIMMFIDDYANSIIVGTTMRPITDKQRISREKLAYICDSTAAPISSMMPLSTWIAAELIAIAGALAIVGIDANPFVVFFQTIPYRFYSIFALVMVFSVVLLNRDYGPMYHAERRARSTGDVAGVPTDTVASSEDLLKPAESTRRSVWSMIVPIVVFIIITVAGLFYSGGSSVEAEYQGNLATVAEYGIESAEGAVAAEDIVFYESLTTVQRGFLYIGNSDASVVLNWASILAIITAMIFGVTHGVGFTKILESFVEGMKTMLLAVTILALALALKDVISTMGLGEWLGEQASSFLAPSVLPMLVFISALGMAFATGTAWGTNAILMPIVIPVAASIGASNEVTPLLLASIGAVLTGAVFGDHCSPISDTTILSSSGAGCDHVSHVKTQAPYAITVAAVSLVAFLFAGFGVSPFILIPLGACTILGIVRFVGRNPEEGLG